MAVKLLPLSLVNRPMAGNSFSADVKRLQRLVHPNIIRYLGGAVEDGQPYLALELVQGESLRDLLDRRGKLPWEMAVDIVDEICLALKHAHQAGFVHQRLTPTRVLLPQGGGVKICGFDCAWCDTRRRAGSAGADVGGPLSGAGGVSRQAIGVVAAVRFVQRGRDALRMSVRRTALAGRQRLPNWCRPAAMAMPRACRRKVLDCPVWLDVLTSKLLAVKRAERLSSADEAHRAIVNAKEKVASGMSATQQAISGRKGMFKVKSDRDEIVRAQASTCRPRSATRVRFTSGCGFLALCLVLLAAGGWWALQPASEEKLIAKATAVDGVGQHGRLEERPKSINRRPCLRTIPIQGSAERDQGVRERKHDGSGRNARRNQRATRIDRPIPRPSGCTPRPGNIEKTGDRMTAWQKYEALIGLFSKSDDEFDQAYVGLARQRIENIKSDPEAAKASWILSEVRSTRPSNCKGQGNLLEARRILDSVISLYEGNQELQPLVDQARTLMQNLSGNN